MGVLTTRALLLGSVLGPLVSGNSNVEGSLVNGGSQAGRSLVN